MRRNCDWRSDATLFGAALTAYPRSAKAAYQYLRSGRPDGPKLLHSAGLQALEQEASDKAEEAEANPKRQQRGPRMQDQPVSAWGLHGVSLETRKMLSITFWIW